MIRRSDPDAIAPYLRDASNMGGGAADAVAVPESIDDVAAVLAECHRSGTPVTVAGAGTGLSGARVPLGGMVLSTERLNRIISIDEEARRARVQAGALLCDVQAAVERLDLFYPPDPTERTCSIGGTIATNASGARTFKYGPTRGYVAALEVVLADGDRLSLRRGETVARGGQLSVTTLSGRTLTLPVPIYPVPDVKHAAGYHSGVDADAVDLFVGSEGTLGVVVEAELALLGLPQRLISGVVFFEREEDTVEFVERAREMSRAARSGASGPIDARALEFIDARGLSLVRGSYPQIPVLANGGCIWFEQEVTDEGEEATLEAWFALMQSHSALTDESWFAMGIEEQRRLRDFRHAVPSAVYEFVTEHGSTKIGTDMAVPDGRLRDLLSFYRASLDAAQLPNATWGHIGNNHLHANILTTSPEEYRRGRELYDGFVTQALHLGGTVSAEHGIGKLKKRYLEQMFGLDGIAQMRALKHALDPRCILGRDTMFDCTY